VDGRAVLVVVGRGEVERGLVAGQGGIEVIDQRLVGGAGGAGVVEPVQRDPRQLTVGDGAADPVMLRSEVEPTLLPVLGLVEVAQAGHGKVDAPDGARQIRLPGAVLDPSKQIERL